MSLDLYIISKTPIKKTGTGVYIRENGETRELKTKEEVKRYFPGQEVEEKTYETDEVWHGNLTHNLGRMADKVCSGNRTLYQLLWHPTEITVTRGWVSEVFECYQELKNRKDYFQPMEEENRITEKNGKTYLWGTYDNMVKFTKSLLECLLDLDYENTEYDLIAST